MSRRTSQAPGRPVVAPEKSPVCLPGWERPEESTVCRGAQCTLGGTQWGPQRAPAHPPWGLCAKADCTPCLLELCVLAAPLVPAAPSEGKVQTGTPRSHETCLGQASKPSFQVDPPQPPAGREF